MSEEILQRLVDCAHVGKITTATSVEKETHWRRDWIDKSITSLLTVIEAHSSRPPVLGISTSGASSNVAVPRVSFVRKTVTCSACRMVGHNKANASCPKKLVGAAASSSTSANNENAVLTMAQPAPLPIRGALVFQHHNLVAPTQTIPTLQSLADPTGVSRPDQQLQYAPQAQYHSDNFPLAVIANFLFNILFLV
ncbi:hypothetical protein FIBSPDRAFT_964226 [Athelia psychrophila]|uniref:Zinc knuckle domain-containing protein n=1 Tax=Athelia psychrophila TaxID=1759441 RepID=A0A165Y1R9_9AGAM|nr:hypothetical protein FIBSPDRAFT_964226 [Fibularhizoctonia sp. CBS 109695]